MDYLKTIDIASMTNVLNHGGQIKESINLPALFSKVVPNHV
jgi:hypothetical protein